MGVLVVDDRPESSREAMEEELIANKKKLVQQTWRAVELGLDVRATVAFYNRLFEKYPDTVAMFEGANMELQAKKLYEVLQVAVRCLDSLDALVPVLEDLGERHAIAYGVKREHYDAVTDVFIEVLNNYISANWEQSFQFHGLWKIQVAEAWAWVLTLVGKTMADAADKAINAKASTDDSVDDTKPIEATS